MNEPLIWKPFPKQEAVASLPDTIFEALFGGSAGPGKTELLMMLPMIRGFYKEPRFKGIVFRRTYPELEHEIINRSHNWYPHFGGRYNQEKKSWKFPSGATIRFGHAEYESDVRKYDTDEYNYMAFDELTSFTEFQYKYLTRSRCRSSDSRLPAIARSATNPGNVGHLWVRSHFIEVSGSAVVPGTIIVDKKTGLKRIFVQAYTTDNPQLLQNDPQYINRLQSLPEAERRAKLEGDWYVFEGQVFEDYRENPLEFEPENACHVYTPFRIPDWWLRFLAIDWGYTAMTYALWGALSPDNRLYCYREYSAKKAKISTWADEIRILSAHEQFSDVVMCRSAWQNRGEELLIADQFEKISGIRPRHADNDRIAGKLLIQEYLRWKKTESKVIPINGQYDLNIANGILRNQGLDAYNDYIDSFTPRNISESLPKLQISPDCKELRKALPLCIYDKKNSVSNKPAEDVKEFDGDDPYDTLRYLICAADRKVNALKSEGDHRDKVSVILRDRDESGDMTSFYRRMSYVESQGRVRDIKPIRRFH